MRTLLVVSNRQSWPLVIPGVEVVTARQYLTDPECAAPGRARVFNLCRSYRYQSLGYYVSLLAEARGHRPLPSVATIEDLKTPSLVRYYSGELEQLIQRSLASLVTEEFTLSIYFARNLAARYDRLSLELFNLFAAPMLRAEVEKVHGVWELARIRPIPTSEIPESHQDFVIEAAQKYFEGRVRPRKAAANRYEIAILHNPHEKMVTSDEVALKRFVRAAGKLDMGATLITKDDFGSLAEFDALFIRETTHVKDHTFRFSRRAEAEGLVVIDDSQSIIRCMNKVYLAEMLDRYEIPHPRTMIIHKENADQVLAELGLPCVLKQPDSAFSQGVVKVETEETLASELANLLEDSDLVIGQEFLPTAFDWRIGVLDRKALYACRYYMAPRHWQIVKAGGKQGMRFGRVEGVAVDQVPERVVKVAVRAANVVGDGLYGVDVKEVSGRAFVVEVNDNPTIEADAEDQILKDDLYLSVMRCFLDRIEARKNKGARGA